MDQPQDVGAIWGSVNKVQNYLQSFLSLMEQPPAQENMSSHDLPPDVLIGIASFLPTEDFETFATMPSALNTWAQGIALTDEDRNPTLDDYADFQFAETKGWNDVLTRLIGNQHVVPQELFDWTWRHDHPLTLGALFAMNPPRKLDPTVVSDGPSHLYLNQGLYQNLIPVVPPISPNDYSVVRVRRL